MRFATTTSNMMSSVGLPPEVEWQKILSMLDSEDVKVQIHAIKVVANLSAEGFYFLQSSSVDFFFLYINHRLETPFFFVFGKH